MEELEAGLDEIKKSPKDKGVLDMIVCRPAENERKILETGELDLELGLVGDQVAQARDEQAAAGDVRQVARTRGVEALGHGPFEQQLEQLLERLLRLLVAVLAQRRHVDRLVRQRVGQLRRLRAARRRVRRRDVRLQAPLPPQAGR